MDKQTLNKALKALKTTHCASAEGIYFQYIFVVDSHIFFTYMAAVRMRAWLKYWNREDHSIEVVRNTVCTHINTDKDFQRGGLMPGEVFPSDEYEQLLANSQN